MTLSNLASRLNMTVGVLFLVFDLAVTPEGPKALLTYRMRETIPMGR